MIQKHRIAALAGVMLLAAPLIAYAAGKFSTLPIIGGASYCAAYIGSPTGQAGVTGTGGGTGAGSICQVTVPAGPAAIAGTEVMPVDIYAPGTTSGGPVTTALLTLPQLGNGAALDVTTVLTAQTVPANTPFYYLDGAQASALTVTMPAVAIDGQIQKVICEAATVGVLTIAANTGQTVKNSPGVACVAGVAYSYRYTASNSTWYKA